MCETVPWMSFVCVFICCGVFWFWFCDYMDVVWTVLGCGLYVVEWLLTADVGNCLNLVRVVLGRCLDAV